MHDPVERTPSYPGPNERIRDVIRLGGDSPKGSVGNTPERLALVEAYNSLPVGFEGIVVGESTNADGKQIIYINDTMIDQPVGRSPKDSAIDLTIGRERIAMSGRYERISRKWHAIRELGGVAAVGASELWGAHVALGNNVLAQLISGGATAIVYGLGHYKATRMRQNRTTANIKEFTSWVANPDNGAIHFRRDQEHPVLLSDEDIETIPRETLAQIAHNNKGNYTGVPHVTLRPGCMVQNLLQNDRKPAELWRRGLREIAHSLAGTEAAILQLQADLQHANELQELTGVTYTARITELETELQVNYRALLHINIHAVTLQEQRKEEALQEARRREAQEHAALIDAYLKQISNPDEAQNKPHRYENHLLALHGAVHTALLGIDLSIEENQQLVTKLGVYLYHCRELFKGPADTEIMYKGIGQKFGEYLPQLPSWKVVSEDLHDLPLPKQLQT